MLPHMWLIELLQTESLWRSLPTSLYLVKQQVADKQGNVWKVRKPMAVKSLWTSNTWHHFISLGGKVFETQAICMYIQV